MKMQAVKTGGLIVMMLGAILWVAGPIAFAQGKSPEKAKEQKDKAEKGNPGKGKQDNGNRGQSGNGKGNDNGKGNSGNRNDSHPTDMEGRDTHGKNKGVLKARNPLKAEKVYVCHKPGSGDAVTIHISANALDAHLGHGDTQGECVVADRGMKSEESGKGGLKVPVEVREEVYTDIETTRSMADYAEEVIREAEERIGLYRTRIENPADSNISTEVVNEAKELIREAENEIELLRREVGEAKVDLREAENLVVNLFD